MRPKLSGTHLQLQQRAKAARKARSGGVVGGSLPKRAGGAAGETENRPCFAHLGKTGGLYGVPPVAERVAVSSIQCELSCWSCCNMHRINNNRIERQRAAASGSCWDRSLPLVTARSSILAPCYMLAHIESRLLGRQHPKAWAGEIDLAFRVSNFILLFPFIMQADQLSHVFTGIHGL